MLNLLENSPNNTFEINSDGILEGECFLCKESLDIFEKDETHTIKVNDFDMLPMHSRCFLQLYVSLEKFIKTYYLDSQYLYIANPPKNKDIN